MFMQGNEVGGSNERCPLTSNFDAKKIHELKQSVYNAWMRFSN